jgi:glycosyltransferase involved in cell wall biosynthesis
MSPYTIYHLQLDQQMDIYDQIREHGKYYIQIWWRQISLGFLYIEEDDKLDRNDLQLKIIRAIQPCVDFYQSNSDIPDKNYISCFLNNNSYAFHSIMDELFNPYELQSHQESLCISVIICTHNKSKDLFNCLTSLYDQKSLPQEIIVVDNAPSDESTKNVVDKFPDVIYYREDKLGLSNARNSGLRLATCPIVAYTDDDVTVHPLWLQRIWETFLMPEVKAMTGLVLPKLLDTESQEIFEKYWGFTKNYCDREFTYSFIERNLNKAPEVWSIGAGANMAFRKTVFDSVGNFDERLGAGASGCSEDSELWFRILLNGHRIHYNPRAITFHLHRTDMKTLRRQLFYYARGHMAAALIQESLVKDAGYSKRVFVGYPKFYIRRLIKGFPFYKNRNRTLLSEILGWYAGIRFFKKYCKKKKHQYKGKQRIITETVNSSKAI